MAGRKKATKTTELVGNDDGAAPLDSAAFLKAASPVLKLLKADLLARSEASPSVRAALTERHERERKAQRTGDSFVEWRGHFIDQVAAAWLLSCVFVRTLEDRKLLGHARLAGPGAQDSQKLFFEVAPSLTERDYLLTTLRELSRFDSTRALFDGEHNPVWMLAPSAEAAKALLQLFRSPTAETPAFRFGQSDTRFLGDLYQDLDEGVQKRFALLQTPVFVEEYILDRTLEPAIQRFGLDETTLIDPTCGSGHFLLGAFARLFEHRRRAEPGGAEREAVYKALSAVAGADINPFAIAIARLRLTLAALEKAHFTRLADAPALPLNLAVADSLLYNPQISQQELGMLPESDGELWLGTCYALEDVVAARKVLHHKYTAVVGNPPYITCKDSALRAAYARIYSSCSMNYALAVPFTERFFQLARNGAFVGMITANSFMKREFGKKLIQEVLPTLNLTRIENTSGAYIPGHGTPTVLLFGTAEPPQDSSVHVILANRGEPSTPSDPSLGFVWRSITQHGDETGFGNEFISVSRVERTTLSKHPWSLGGGGASELKALLEDRAPQTLADIIEHIGFSLIIGEDEIFIRRTGAQSLANLPTIPLVIGENVRDWSLTTPESILRPFNEITLQPEADTSLQRELWPWRATLEARIVSGSTSMKESGREWFDVRRLSRDKHRTPLSITFAFVATHNHFVLDRGGKVFKQSAPIIKLPETATEEDHLALLAYLNSSTACFWMKQVFYPKGGDQMGDGGRLSATSWEDRYEFAGTALLQLPIPPLGSLVSFGAKLDALAMRRASLKPSTLLGRKDWPSKVEASRVEEAALFAELVATQEALDWEVYRLFELASDDQAEIDRTDRPGQRAFERLLWDRTGPTDPDRAWFSRASYTTQQASPSKRCKERTLAIQSSKSLQILEGLDFKRWWRPSDFDSELREAVKAELLNRLEQIIRSHEGIQTATALQKELAAGFESSTLFEISQSTLDPTTLLLNEAAPFLTTYRFTESGLARYSEWCRTWDLQRREDLGEKVSISVPSKYSQKDYRSPTIWRLRGRLDVPHERFISYPGCESDEDGSPVYGWAGWNHLERAQALAALYTDRKDREGWKKERLLPMLAGILELLPWIKQWHNDPSDEYDGQRLGNFFEGYLEGQLREHGVTIADLESLRPEPRAPKSKRSPTTKAPAA